MLLCYYVVIIFSTAAESQKRLQSNTLPITGLLWNVLQFLISILVKAVYMHVDKCINEYVSLDCINNNLLLPSFLMILKSVRIYRE